MIDKDRIVNAASKIPVAGATNKYSCEGFSLVELLIALALSLTLIIGVLTIYMDSSATARTSTALARVQEAARIGLEIMSREARMAGFQGCADTYETPMTMHADNPPPSLTPTTGFQRFLAETAVQGWEVTAVNQSSWASGTDLDGVSGVVNGTSQAIANSDVLMIQRFRPLGVEVSDDMSSELSDLTVTDPNGVFGSGGLFGSGDLLMVGNCDNVEVFRLSATPTGSPLRLKHRDTVNSSSELLNVYKKNDDSQVYALQSTAFFVGDTGRDDERGNPIFALYRATNNLTNSATASFTVEELVEGVESLQLQYGVRRDAASNQVEYLSADSLGARDWLSVVSLRIGVLVSGVESVLLTEDDNTYDLPGARFTKAGAGTDLPHAADQRLRKAFSGFIKVRNRGCGQVTWLPVPGSDDWEWVDADKNNADGDPCN